jgi:hypothetical protein
VRLLKRCVSWVFLRISAVSFVRPVARETDGVNYQAKATFVRS